MGLFSPTNTGNWWICVVVDYLTKWPIAVALPDKQVAMVACAFVEHVVCVHGAPESVLSDQGWEFLNDVLKRVNNDLHIHKLTTSAYHPQTDGLAEWFNGTLQNMLSMYVVDDQKDWDLYLPYVLAVYRAMVHESTKETPFYLVYGCDHYLLLDVVLGLLQCDWGSSLEDYWSNLVTQLAQAFGITWQFQLNTQVKNQVHYDCNHVDQCYTVGEKVWLHWPHMWNQHSKKLEETP